jgi:hypothetical protein
MLRAEQEYEPEQPRIQQLLYTISVDPDERGSSGAPATQNPSKKSVKIECWDASGAGPGNCGKDRQK